MSGPIAWGSSLRLTCSQKNSCPGRKPLDGLRGSVRRLKCFAVLCLLGCLNSGNHGKSYMTTPAHTGNRICSI
jgi:hypothetical protein